MLGSDIITETILVVLRILFLWDEFFNRRSEDFVIVLGSVIYELHKIVLVVLVTILMQIIRGLRIELVAHVHMLSNWMLGIVVKTATMLVVLKILLLRVAFDVLVIRWWHVR